MSTQKPSLSFSFNQSSQSPVLRFSLHPSSGASSHPRPEGLQGSSLRAQGYGMQAGSTASRQGAGAQLCSMSHHPYPGAPGTFPTLQLDGPQVRRQVVPGASSFLSALPLHIAGPGLEKSPELGPGGFPTLPSPPLRGGPTSGFSHPPLLPLAAQCFLPITPSCSQLRETSPLSSLEAARNFPSWFFSPAKTEKSTNVC